MKVWSYRSFAFSRSAWLQQLQNIKQFLSEKFHIWTKIFNVIWKFLPKTEYKTSNRQNFNVITLVSKVRPQTTGKAFWMPWSLSHIAHWMQKWHNPKTAHVELILRQSLKYKACSKKTELLLLRTLFYNILSTIPFKEVPSTGDTPLPTFLPLLECFLECTFCDGAQFWACARAQFSGCSSKTNAHSETGQMAVCFQNLPLGALSSRSAPSVLVGALFKMFGLFF